MDPREGRHGSSACSAQCSRVRCLCRCCSGGGACPGTAEPAGRHGPGREPALVLDPVRGPTSSRGLVRITAVGAGATAGTNGIGRSNSSHVGAERSRAGLHQTLLGRDRGSQRRNVGSFPVLATSGAAPSALTTDRDLMLDLPSRVHWRARIGSLEHQAGLGQLSRQPQHTLDLARMALRQPRQGLLQRQRRGDRAQSLRPSR